MAVVLEFSLSRSVDYMIIKVESQNDLTKVLNLDGYESYEIDEIHLSNARYTLDFNTELLRDGYPVNVRGEGDTVICIVNAPEEESPVDAESVQTFTTSFQVFSDCTITTDEFLEILFMDKEDLDGWTNVSFDTSKVRVLVLSELVDDFLNSYDVEGVLEEGDHVVVDRGIYTHHGVYVGNNELIHYAGSPGTSGTISRIKLERFARKDPFWVYDHDERFSRAETVERAESRLGENEYNLAFNNCEHFAHWCCTGTEWSNQVFGTFMGLGGMILSALANDGGKRKYRLS